jgi:hypothetical protein
MIVFLLAVGIWIANAIAEGYVEAGYWHYKYTRKGTRKPLFEHQVWTLQRGIVMVLLGYLMWNYLDWYSIFGCVGMMFVFPFFHDGAYYYYRNKLDGSYPKGWKDYSTTSTAKFSANYQFRVFMVIVSLVFFIAAFGKFYPLLK